MSGARATIFVCVSCRTPVEGSEDAFDKPGRALASDIAAHLRDAGASDIDVRPVECLAVCKRPCTIALAGENKWTYIAGDIAGAQAAEIAEAAQRFAASEDGIIPWKERPLCLRKGIVARVPPDTYRIAETLE
jgi:predicted metal-binding protein